MTVKKNIFVVVITLLSITINSCNSTDIVTNKAAQPTTIENKKDEFKQICDSSNSIVFKLYDLSSDSNLLEDLTKVIWLDSIKDSKRIESFNNFFNSVENGGYCCCTKTHYSVTFYRDKNKLDTYLIDTSDIKDKVTLFSNGYQTSYIIPLKDFNSFIREK